MLRRSSRKLLPIVATCMPTNLHSSMDVAFYFPRFQPITHATAMGIPEIEDALRVLQPDYATLAVPVSHPKCPELVSRVQTRWSTSGAGFGTLAEAPQQRADRLRDRDRGLSLLERGIDILENIGGVASKDKSITNLLRPLYAIRFELLNGTEHLPRPEYAKRAHVHKLILQQSARLLYYNDFWDKGDLRQIDTTCLIIAHFIKAFCALHQKPFNASPGPSAEVSSAGKDDLDAASAPSRGKPNVRDWCICVGGSEHPEALLALPTVMERLDECLCLATEAYKQHGGVCPELRWLPPKLLILKALLNIPLTGNLFFSMQYVDKSLQKVEKMTAYTNPLLYGLKERRQEPEVGIFLLIKAELTARMFNWALPPGETDATVMRSFEEAADFFATPFQSSLDADGIMSAAHIHERWYEAQAYTICLVSYATFLLNAPRPSAASLRDSPVFLPKQTFDTNPLMGVASPSDMNFFDIKDRVNFSIEQCRRKTGAAFDRALQVNRMVFPEYKDNPQAAWALLGMACMYADARDYLYATGLFEAALKNIARDYGQTSLEAVLVQKLRYEFLAGVGSEQEAKTASHGVVRLLKQLDQLPPQHG